MSSKGGTSTSLLPMTSKPLPYTPAVRAGEFLFVSGQVAIRDGALIDDGFEPQVKQSLANLQSVLTQNGAAITDVVKTTVFLVDMADFGPMNEIYAEFFGDHLPARSTVAVAALPNGALFEIDAVARV